MATKIDSIIDSLNKLNEDSTKTISLPFSKLNIGLKPLLAKHVSQINSSLLAGGDGSYGVKFPLLMAKIFKDILILPEGVTYADFNIFDYHYILFKIRETINPMVEISTQGDPITVDIRKNLKAFEKLSTIKPKTFGRKGCKITIEPPSYDRMKRFDEIIEARHRKEGDTPDYESLSLDVFAFTLIKFIKSISVVVDNEPTEVEFSKVSPDVQKRLLNSIPKEEYQKIFKEIEKQSVPIKVLTKTDDEEITIPVDHSLLIDSN